MTMKSLTSNGTIRSSVQRPKVSFNVELNVEGEDMASVKDTDPLPIVELKPFVQKVWRREKSFAGTWERSPSVATVKSEKSDTAVCKTKDIETVSTVTFESGPEDASISPPPRTSHSLPSRLTERFLTVYVNAFDDFKSQKEHFHRFVGESSFKTKNRLHPVVDPKNKKQLEHSVNIIQGFITRDDRTKTTLTEISEGDSISRFYSCSPKAIGPDEVRKQQQLRVSGEKLDQLRRSSPQVSSPAPSRIINGSWHGASIRHGSPASMLYHNKKESRVKRTKTPLYDHLDRTGSLPSLSINSTSLKSRGTKKQFDNNSEDYVDYTDTYNAEFKHNVGGIENSLIVLSKHGAPTKVERQISFELEKNLSRFRKLKDYSPFEINPSELAKYYPPPTFNMTQGEARIRQAMQSNTSKYKQRKLRTNRSVHGASLGTGISSFNERHNNKFTHGILKNPYNEIDHIDSFDNLYGPYNRASTTEYTPNEEPNVPFDTPRSRVESRISSKVHEASSLESKEKVGTKEIKSVVKEDIQSEMKLVSDTETKMSTVKVSPHEKAKNEENKIDTENDVDVKTIEPKLKNEKNETVDIKSVQMKTAHPQSKQIDASGRTFLTSDAMPQMGIVTS
ncbi:uncharacterized protein LOC128556327 [Mercenaria mercenaria]|uniref:uncharacterized protein LOC128556327 n=1 Tax=Mercenaria mercenaria TaxID=6596 RepID=UPI00234EF171|nr:uncharacterized protein LOC128556327 [Mercenaria mercenaria]